MTALPRDVTAGYGGGFGGRPELPKKGLIWCLGSILLVSVAQLALKYAMMELPPLAFEDLSLLREARLSLTMALTMPLAMLAGGLGAYALSMLCWFLALRHLPLNYAYPMLSLSYVLVYLAAVALPWFGEPAGMLKSCGILLILLGVWLINSGRPEKP